MENQLLVLKFKDQEQEYSFENNVFVLEDKKLIQNLSKPNIKNQDSDLIIKSLNDTHVADVIQVKINVGDTGTFLVSFNKESLSDESRSKLLEEIGKLKNTETPSIELQSQKIKELLGILNNFAPIYATFANTGDIKFNLEDVVDFDLSFPLLVLKQPEKKLIFKVSKSQKSDKQENQEIKPEKVKKEYHPFALFSSDYFFGLFFALLAAFSITASVFELMNKQGIAAFLIVLAVALTITLVIAVTSIIYKKGELRNPWLRYYIGIYVLVGIVAGVVASFFICKGVLKTEIADFNYKKMILISSLISASLLLSLTLSRLVNIIFMKIRENKKPQ